MWSTSKRRVVLDVTSKILRSSPLRGWPIWNIYVTNDNGYVPLVVNTSRYFPDSRIITEFVTRLTRCVPLVEQELPTLPDHLGSPPVFSGVRVTRSLVLCVCFSRSLFVLLHFFFWSLCCLFVFDIRILITPLVSSNSSCREGHDITELLLKVTLNNILPE
jgi:hypothetical protein